MVLWDWVEDTKVEVKLVGRKQGEASTPKPVVVEQYPTHGRVNSKGFTIEEEMLRA